MNYQYELNLRFIGPFFQSIFSLGLHSCFKPYRRFTQERNKAQEDTKNSVKRKMYFGSR